MEQYEYDPELQEANEEEEIVPLIVGPVGKVPVKYILDYSKEGQTQEEREEYINLLAQLGINICAKALDYNDPFIASTLPELEALDTNPDVVDPYEYVKPKLITINQKVAFTVYYHKNLPKSIVDDLSHQLFQGKDNLRIKDFDVVTTMVCFDDSIMTEFEYRTEVAKLPIGCFHFDDVVLYLSDSENPKDKPTLCIRILYLPDQTGESGEYDSTASFVIALNKDVKEAIKEELGHLKLDLSPEALSYVNTTKGTVTKPSANCFDVIQFHKLAKVSLNALSQAVNKNIVQ